MGDHRLAAQNPPVDAAPTIPFVQTRYLILAALITGLAIIAAAAVWFTQL